MTAVFYAKAFTETDVLELPLKTARSGNVETVTIGMETLKTLPPLKYVEIHSDDSAAFEGSDGYFVSPNNMLTHFHDHKDVTRATGPMAMPVFGVKTPDVCFVAIAAGHKFDMAPVIEIKGGRYEIFARFLLDLDPAYEDISVEYHYLTGTDADYCGMAREYRRHQLDHGCHPISERIAEHPTLKYSADSIYVRIRCGWKPVPSPVEEQTPETEPPMHAAVTFERAGQILDEFKRQGIEKAEICLVGWNMRGHDGRWPQALPVEESLGGEAGLQKLMEKAKKLGYTLVCHTNSTDAYSIAENWSRDYIIKNRDGSLSKGFPWGGGRMYNTCPAGEREINHRMLDETAALGFHGTHYVDVISTVSPRKCYDPKHPQTRRDFAREMNELLSYAKSIFGGVSSEGGFDYVAGELDYGLYIVFGNPASFPAGDEYIPFWQLVYNGIILSNPSTDTINPTLKGRDCELAMIAAGGRPSYYYYSRFVTPDSGSKNWMGDEDLECGDDETLKKGVADVKRGWDIYRELSPLQYVFLDRYDPLGGKTVRLSYSDGSRLYVNRSDSDGVFDGIKVGAMSYLLVK